MQIVSPVGLQFQEFKDLFEFPGLVPILEVAVAGAVRNSKVMGEIIPAAAGGQDVEDAVGNVLEIGLRASRSSAASDDERGQEPELADC